MGDAGMIEARWESWGADVMVEVRGSKKTGEKLYVHPFHRWNADKRLKFV
jgi:hypothetical protein